MRRVLKLAMVSVALATAGVGAVSPAFAAISLQQQTGPDLDTKIYAAHDGAADVGSTVYGTTVLNSGHDVAFTGYSSFNLAPGANNSGNTTTIDITGGSGFAQVADHNWVNPTGPNPNPTQDDLFFLLFDPTPTFYLYEFSVQTLAAGQTLEVYYSLASGPNAGLWILASPAFLNKSGDTQYIFGDPNNTAWDVDKVLISSASPIEHAKQNSIQLTNTIRSPVPEPGSWALMILGFAGLGMAVRRNRKRQPALMQLA